MTTFLFLSGLGLGAFIATVVLLFILARVRFVSEETKAYNARILELMEERNAIDKAVHYSIGRIADLMDEALRLEKEGKDL